MLSFPVQVFDVAPQLCSFYLFIFNKKKFKLFFFFWLYFLCIGIEHLLWILFLNI